MCDKSVPGMFRYERKLQKILKSFEIYEHKDNHYINKKKKQKYLKSLNGLITFPARPRSYYKSNILDENSLFKRTKKPIASQSSAPFPKL